MTPKNTNESQAIQRSNGPVQFGIVFLTIIFCAFSVHVWLPEHIGPMMGFDKQDQDQKLATADESSDQSTKVSNSLLEHIKNTRKDKKTSASLSDQVLEDELIEEFEKFEEDYSNKAEEIIANRFKHPNLAEFDNDQLSQDFTPPEGLKDVFTFWTHMFGLYTRDHIIFYNEDDVGVVYSVLDFSEIKGKKSDLGGVKAQIIRDERRRIKKMLTHVAAVMADENFSLKKLPKDEQRIAELLLKNKAHLKIDEKSLQSSLKHRYGFAHRIRKAIMTSGKYMDEMQRIFTERGLPKELTAIPFVESAFDLDAYSHAGAAGIWQFIGATGKRYLRIDDYVDERYDPILAAYAAATHLSNEYKLLKSWPLTINAYNTGPGRMLQAMRQLNTNDITTIIKTFKGSGYGFDSRNYYPEIIAAMHVYNNRHHYFGDIPVNNPEEYEYLAMPSPMNIRELARQAGIPLTIIRKMNLSLKDAVLAGQHKLPKGYLIKIPPQSKQDMLVALQELHRDIQYATHHMVKRGDSLKEIAERYDVTVQELAKTNQLLPGQRLKKGMMIKLPGRENFEYSNLDPDSEMVVPDKLSVPVF